ncbi:MAG: GNAT family N-acetyltransferase [Candidatus Latescibacteria bacterium]|nr:GNAT family N-acetyltransferase [Candidatus Latescibacterota bacterium]
MANTDEVQLRAATEEDVLALIDIARKAFLFAFWELSPIQVLRDWVADDFEGRCYPERWPRMIVATVCGKPVGLVEPVDDHISGLWIHPHYHRQGIGTQLLQAGEEVVRQHGHSKVWLMVSCFNAGAPMFYRALGYHKVGVETEILSTGIEEDLTRFERDL